MSVILWRRCLEFSLGVTLFASLTRSDCIFEKHFGRRLVQPTEVGLIQEVRGMVRCDMLCLDHHDRCVAANAILINKNIYRCEIITELPDGFNVNQLLPIPRGKFISRKGPSKLEIISCSSSTFDNQNYICGNVYDGELTPGSGREWAASLSDNNQWIKLNLDALQLVAMIKIWWRCAGRSQFSELKLSFSDGSEQKITHRCSTESNWLRCGGDPEEVHYITPVLTDYVNISGVDCENNQGNNGFRELEILRP